MDYRRRKYYLLCAYSGYMEDIIEIIKLQLGTNVKMHKLQNTNIPVSYCKIMISCNSVYKDKLTDIISIMSLLLKNRYKRINLYYREYYKRNYTRFANSYVPLEQIYFKEITEEDLGQ